MGICDKWLLILSRILKRHEPALKQLYPNAAVTHIETAIVECGRVVNVGFCLDSSSQAIHSQIVRHAIDDTSRSSFFANNQPRILGQSLARLSETVEWVDADIQRPEGLPIRDTRRRQARLSLEPFDGLLGPPPEAIIRHKRVSRRIMHPQRHELLLQRSNFRASLSLPKHTIIHGRARAACTSTDRTQCRLDVGIASLGRRVEIRFRDLSVSAHQRFLARRILECRLVSFRESGGFPSIEIAVAGFDR